MIAIERVTKRFGELTAVDGLSFEIDRGEVVGFLGPNGAGKTTTMKMLTGGLEPDEGTIRLDGHSIQNDLVATRARIGYLPEANPLYDDMLVCEYLEHAGRLRDLRAGDLRAAVRDAVDETDLGSVFYRPVGELSKGFRQRVGLTAAILHRPEVLVLDEPTEGLDPNQRVEIRRLVNSLGKERTVLLSTHVMQEVEATCSRLLIIARGALVADGTVDAIAAARARGARVVVEIEGDGLEEGLAALDGVTDVRMEPTANRWRAELMVSSGEEIRPAVFGLAKERGWTLWELRLEHVNLEDLFRHLTAEGE